MRLFTVLPTCPAPSGPRWWDLRGERREQRRQVGDVRGRAADEQVEPPASAPRMPPVNAASTTRTPRGRSSCSTARQVAVCTELQTTSTAPAGADRAVLPGHQPDVVVRGTISSAARQSPRSSTVDVLRAPADSAAARRSADRSQDGQREAGPDQVRGDRAAHRAGADEREAILGAEGPWPEWYVH
jgi:hypothetical protein